MPKLRDVIVLAVLALIVAMPTLTRAMKPSSTYELHADGDIEVGIDGAVRNYTLKDKLPQEIAGIVDRRVRTWMFEPVTVDSRPVTAKTHMRLTLLAAPLDDQRFMLTVKRVRFGVPERSSTMTPPQYPVEAARANIGAKVILAIRTDMHGKVTDVLAEQTSLVLRAEPRNGDKWRVMFENSSIKAARSWALHGGEEIDGQSVSAVILTPVDFAVTNLDTLWPGPVRPIPWLQSGIAVRPADRDASASDMQSLSTRFHLRHDVIGKAL